jgi:hypothetical protein
MHCTDSAVAAADSHCLLDALPACSCHSTDEATGASRIIHIARDFLRFASELRAAVQSDDAVSLSE